MQNYFRRCHIILSTFCIPLKVSSSVLKYFLTLMYAITRNFTIFHALSLDYSVGQFFEDGRQATKDILSRGRVPIVTGGTGLYLRWYVLCPFLYNVKSESSFIIIMLSLSR